SEIVDVLSHEELSDEEQLNILFTYVVELSQGDDYSQQYLHLLQDELPATEVATGIVRVLKAFGDAVSGGLEVKVKSNVQANGSKQGWKYCFKCSSRKGGV
ncbi:MAG: hypothetical protein OXC40_04060, partial [Proteobacteria bacterium]|nr:hypothetical protein [Pseudomonadota bacterium]